MRIGFFTLKLKPVIVWGTLLAVPYTAIRLERRFRYKAIFKKEEQLQILSAQEAAMQFKTLDHELEFVNHKNEIVHVSDLDGEFKILLFLQQGEYQRYVNALEMELKRFKIRCYNVTQNAGQLKGEHILELREDFNQKIVAFHNDELFYAEELNEASEPSKTCQLIKMKINRLLDKQFLQQLRF